MQEGNTNAAEAVSTSSGRDSMLRTAVQANLREIRYRRVLSSVPPRELVCGLGRALGVPENRVVQITHAAVAAEARAVMLSIAAAQRAGQAQRAADEVCTRDATIAVSGCATGRLVSKALTSRHWSTMLSLLHVLLMRF